MRIRTCLAFVLGAVVGCLVLVGHALSTLVPHQRRFE